MADVGWREGLDGRPEPFLATMGHKKRRSWAPAYLQGLIGPGDRKSLQPMAIGPGLRGRDRLRRLVASTTRGDAPPRRPPVGRAAGPDAVLVVGAAPPKRGS